MAEAVSEAQALRTVDFS